MNILVTKTTPLSHSFHKDLKIWSIELMCCIAGKVFRRWIWWHFSANTHMSTSRLFTSTCQIVISTFQKKIITNISYIYCFHRMLMPQTVNYLSTQYLTSRPNFLTSRHNDLTSRHNYIKLS